MAITESNPNSKKHPPSVKGISTILFFVVAFSLLLSRLNFDQKSNNEFLEIIFSFNLFYFFALVSSIYHLMTIKFIYVNNNELTIRYPFIFKTDHINLSDIKDRVEKNFIIVSSKYGPAKNTSIHVGKILTLTYGNKKELEFYSYMIKDFDSLSNYLKKQIDYKAKD